MVNIYVYLHFLITLRSPLLHFDDFCFFHILKSKITRSYSLVSNKNSVASGTALIMEMSGINLLLSNGFLREFKSLWIDYGNGNPELTLGTSMLVEHDQVHRTEV